MLTSTIYLIHCRVDNENWVKVIKVTQYHSSILCVFAKFVESHQTAQGKLKIGLV